MIRRIVQIEWPRGIKPSLRCSRTQDLELQNLSISRILRSVLFFAVLSVFFIFLLFFLFLGSIKFLLLRITCQVSQWGTKLEGSCIRQKGNANFYHVIKFPL